MNTVLSTSVDLREIESEAEIALAFPVMRELRPHLADAAEMVARVKRQRQEGYRLLGAFRGGAPIGLAGYRMHENLIHGKLLYVDDLVVTAAERRNKIGARLLDAAMEIAKERNCRVLSLDTGLDNMFAQRFYFRWGLLASGLHFTRRLV